MLVNKHLALGRSGETRVFEFVEVTQFLEFGRAWSQGHWKEKMAHGERPMAQGSDSMHEAIPAEFVDSPSSSRQNDLGDWIKGKKERSMPYHSGEPKGGLTYDNGNSQTGGSTPVSALGGPYLLGG